MGTPELTAARPQNQEIPLFELIVSFPHRGDALNVSDGVLLPLQSGVQMTLKGLNLCLQAGEPLPLALADTIEQYPTSLSPSN